MQGADKGQAGRLDGHDLRVGIVQARFNDELTSRLAAVCIDELVKLGVAAKHIQHVTVPGALEVPVALQAMADSERFDALVALGCIIRGETYHFELVANESGAGVTRVSLDHHRQRHPDGREPGPGRGPHRREGPRCSPRCRRDGQPAG